jgi:hypothetical protein
MIDVFDYSAPLGLLGRLVERLLLDGHLRRLLVERGLVIKSVAESGDYARYLGPARQTIASDGAPPRR